MRSWKRIMIVWTLLFVAAACGASGSDPAGGGSGNSCDDAACSAAFGLGSLCLSGSCTKAAEACDARDLVVVDAGFVGPIDSGLDEACFFRDLDAAMAATVPEVSRRLMVFAEAAEADGPILLPPGLAMEGRPSPGAGATVTLNIAAAAPGDSLVTLSDGSSLRGFALDGGGTFRGVKALAGSAALTGPLKIARTPLALELVAGSQTTLAGEAAEPLLLQDNQVGILVPDEAALELNGDGAGGGVTLERTSEGAGLLILSGGASAEVRISGLLARGNDGSSAQGTGAVEIRRGRRVAIRDSVFENNRRGLNLNGEGLAQIDSFNGIEWQGNQFVIPANGVALCATSSNSEVKARPGLGNVFNGAPLDSEAECNATAVAASCETGGAFGFTGGAAGLDVDCSLLP